jgi:hypothetical protein
MAIDRRGEQPSVMSELFAPLDSMRTPMGKLGAIAVLGAIATVAGALVGLSADSVVAAAAAYVAIVLAALLALALRAAERFRARVAVTASGEARLLLGKAQVTEGAEVRDVHGSFVGHATFAAIPVINELGASAGADVHATVQVETLDGTPLSGKLTARWRTPGHGAVSSEIDIPANARPHLVETVMCFADGGSTYVWNSDSRATADAAAGARLADRFEVRARDFLVWVTVMGSNAPRAASAFRIQRTASVLRVVPLDAPSAPSDADLAPEPARPGALSAR